MSSQQNKHDIWYDLDNAANIFPAISNDSNTNVFRIACELKETVDKEVLEKAVDAALQDYAYFRVVMRRGLFWFYLENTQKSPVISQEAQRPCARLFYTSHKELLFRITYYRFRINVEVFHSVSDGSGTMQFLLAILYHYIRIAYGVRLPLPNPSPPIQHVEDSFLHHYNPDQKKPPNQKRAYTINGTMLPGNSTRVICGEMRTKQVLALAKSKGVTVTAYLAALMICAIYTEMMPTRAKNKPVGVNIPIDLRKYFVSASARNFFSVTEVMYNFDGASPDFDRVLESVSTQLLENVQPERVAERMNYTMGVQKNIFARAVPLILKNMVLKAAYANSEHATTCALSNVGRVDLPDAYAPYIKRFTCLLNPTNIHKIKACVCSYGEHFVLNFTSCIAESKVETYVFRHFSQNGVEVCLTGNGADDNEIL